MQEDGLGDYIKEDKQPFAYEEYVELKKQYQELRDKVWEHRSENMKMRDTVRNFFQERYTDNEHPDDLTFDIDEINELLSSIDTSQLLKRFEANATVEITFKVIAEDKNDAENIINDYLADLSIYVSKEDDYEVDSYDVSVDE